MRERAIIEEQQLGRSRRMTRRRLAVAAAASFAAAFTLAACQNVATYSEPSLVRFIDASYVAPAANAVVEGQLVAANVGQGTITSYATVSVNSAALIQIEDTSTSKALVTTNGTLLAGKEHSVFLTDNGTASSGYVVTILEDQNTAAASNHSAFRFLNQAPKTGAVDIYMVPSNSTLANSVPLVTNLAVGGTAGYVSFVSQTVTLVVTPTGTTTPKYTSSSLALTGGEVRTVLIMDTQLTSDPPVMVSIAADAGPAD